jgi:protoporphyrin/coproporphyrin ferrochelatase
MNKTGIILMNLGSPASTNVKDVKTYLKEFLMDHRVIDKPFLLRWFLVNGIIAPFRAPRSAEAYKKIWRENGSPLILLTKQLQEVVQGKTAWPVTISMRYGKPTPDEAYKELLQKLPDINEVIIFPLYPHYAMSSYETAVEQMKTVHKKNKYGFQLKIVAPFYNHPHYIDALANSIKPYLNEDYDQLLFSYHGIPESHIMKSDTTKQHCLQIEDCCHQSNKAHAACYRHQVTITSELVAAALQLPKDKWQLSFQSRLGRKAPWLAPSTQTRLATLPKEGIKKLLVVCPSFVSDCLETLEEISIQGKGIFLQNGGEQFTYIPCLNTNAGWVEAMMQLIDETQKEDHSS